MSDILIKLIDLVVFPDYCGGVFTGNAYIEPKTGEKKYFNTFASKELVERWEERVGEVRDNPTRMLIHLRDAENTSGIDYLTNFTRSLDVNLGPTGRYIAVNGHNVENVNLRQRIQEGVLVLANDIRVVGYGHHRGDCVSERGRKVTQSLGLDESLFEELENLSVGDMVLDRLDIVRQENPQVFLYYSDEHVEQLRGQEDFKAVRMIFDARKYLFVYCSAEQVREAARLAKSVEDFEARIGGNFKGFNFLDDYLGLCGKHGHRP